MRRAAAYAWICAASLALLVSNAVAQSCPAACQPEGNGKQGPTSSTVTIGFGSGFSTANISAFQDAIEMWNSAFLQTWSDLWFTSSTYGPAQIIIVVDPALSNGAVNDTDTYGYGTIRIAPNILNQGHDFLTHLMAHELGHSLGFANNFGTGCSTSTIMYGFISPSGPFLSSIPSCDQTAVSNNYPTNPPPPPPQEELQHNGSPIILDLAGDGYRLTRVSDGVEFDLRNEGRKRRVAWTRPGAKNAFVALDRNGNGVIDHRGELFGNYTRLSSGALANHGFEALRELDENGDGVVNSDDEAWRRLLLWTDGDHDGVSTASELQPIADSAVTALEVGARLVGRTDRWGNYFTYLSHFRIRRGGAEGRRICYDVFLRIEE
ncbi:MAG TPA: hypothetical protein VHK90_02180 [Thermoanaerobaculia bacterium]|nr:hypothetical protein [Thermoanaerobaculia bacterium]